MIATAAATHRVAQQGGERQCDGDLWPGGNTAPETTLLSGYGVDTLGWTDNVRGTGSRRGGCPGEFQRGSSAGGKGAVGLGDISDAAPRAGLARHA
jgi:hypothetical protein